MVTIGYRKTAPSGRCPLLFLAVSLLAFDAPPAQADFQGSTHLMPFDEETINYSKTPATDLITELQKRIDAGELELKHQPGVGFLPDLLGALNISSKSQMLVFSKTSLQREHINPGNPRAVYFGDDAYVGYIPGAPLIEVSAVDPKLGAVFYTVEQKPVPKPRFVRTDQCLECHASAKSMGVPGHLVRSFFTDERGVVDLVSGISPITHRTPLADRWGGWYVSGRHGGQSHRGNLIGKEAFARQETEPNYLGNVTDLTPFFDPAKYPRPDSDIVALMVLEHQTHMQNFLTRLQYAATLALRQYGHVNYLKSVTEAYVKYLLFLEEVPLTAPIEGTSGFAEWFPQQGPRDSQGRSLRDLDLQTRLFKYPCSYVIYSGAFDALPSQLKDVIYKRLWQVLAEPDPQPGSRSPSPETRRAIIEILAETKSGLPDYWVDHRLLRGGQPPEADGASGGKAEAASTTSSTADFAHGAR